MQKKARLCLAESMASFNAARPAHEEKAVVRAYRKLALRVHPDKPGGDAAAFAELTAAQEALLWFVGIRDELEGAAAAAGAV